MPFHLCVWALAPSRSVSRSFFVCVILLLYCVTMPNQWSFFLFFVKIICDFPSFILTEINQIKFKTTRNWRFVGVFFFSRLSCNSHEYQPTATITKKETKKIMNPSSLYLVFLFHFILFATRLLHSQCSYEFCNYFKFTVY